MNKDVIYIDVEDDLTAIISKIKSSTHKIIALVPPKRIGVLQSAVTMRLLAKTADAAGKRIVVITNDQALAGLAAAAAIPVAKNLQSKPELAEITALKVDHDDDIIDGRDVPVGVLADSQPGKDSAKDNAVEAIAAAETAAASAKPKPVPKVPNFSIFRKRLVLIGGGAMVLIGGLVWAIWFAPRATVTITAKTTTVTVDKSVRLKLDAPTDAKLGIVRALKQEQAKELSVEFTATGTKKVGEKATGTMKLRRSSISRRPLQVPAGTTFSAGDYMFVSTESATLAGTDIGDNGIVQDTATVRVQATQVGEEYNLSPRSYTSNVSGFIATGSAMSGGSSRQVTVISKDDVAKATQKLQELKDPELEAKLRAQFASSAVVIQESYSEKRSTPATSVPIETEVTGPVALKTTLTASMMAIDKADINAFLTASVNDEISEKKSQKIYNDGVDAVKFAQFANSAEAPTVRLTANAVVGPTIDEGQVKEQAKGKSYGDIQASLEAIEGVEDVNTTFWPFWVRTVPNDVKRIEVKFDIKNGGS